MYKITFSLNHTILQTTPQMLDAVLAKIWLQKYHPEQFSNKPLYREDEIFDFVNSDFPIEFDKEVGIFKASQIFLSGNVQEFVTSEKKRWNEQGHWRLSEKEQSSVDTQRGFMKSANIPRAGYVCTQAEAYFCGNKDKVEELLKDCLGLGKKVVKGYGWIRSYKIEAVDFNFYDKHLRPLPMQLCTKLSFSGQVRTMRLTPPYHQYFNAELCICPNITLF
jgi:CRISPR type IV-associated protein Csf3